MATTKADTAAISLNAYILESLKSVVAFLTQVDGQRSKIP